MAGDPSGANHTPPATVMLVEDDPRLRAVLRTLIDEDPRIEIVHEAATGGQAIAHALAHDVGLVILDHHLADGASGLEAAEALHRARPGMRIIVCSADDEVGKAEDVAADALVSKRNLITLLSTVQRLLGLDD